MVGIAIFFCVAWFVAGIAGTHLGNALCKQDGSMEAGFVWMVIFGPICLAVAIGLAIKKALKVTQK
jgi:hypothetical protein